MATSGKKVATAVLEITTDTGQVKSDLTGLQSIAKSTSKAFQESGSAMSKSFSDFGGYVRQVQGLVNDFSGQKAIQEAHAVAQAVKEIGGASKLTADQQAQVSSVMQAALAAHKARGDEAAASVKGLAAETNKAAAASQGWTSWLGKANGALAAVGAGASIAGVIAFGKSILDDLGHLEDLHEATDVSLEDIQRLGAVASDVGVDVDESAKAVQNLSSRIAGGDKSATSAIGMLGLSVEQLQQAGPMEAFLEIAEAAGKIEDPMVKGQIASDLFGEKLGKKLIPLLGQLRDKMKAVPQGELFSDKDIQDADRFGEAMHHAWVEFEAYTVRAVRWAERNKGSRDQDLAAIVNQAQAAKGGALPSSTTVAPTGALIGSAPTNETLTNAKLIANELQRLRTEAMQPLDAEQKRNIADLHKWGESESDIAKLVHASESAVHLYVDQITKAEEARKKDQEALDKWKQATADAVSHLQPFSAILDTIDGNVVEGAKALIEHGAKVEDVATMYGLTEGQIAAVVDEMKLEQTVVEATGASYAQLKTRLEETLKARLDVANSGFSKNLGTEIAAEQNAIDIRNKMTMSSYELEVTQIKKAAEERKRALDPAASGYSEALQAIADETDAKMAEASQAWQDHVAEMKASEMSWANATRSFLQSVPGLVQQAFTGGGGLSGALKAMTSNLGASLFGEKGPLGFGAGGLLNGLGNKLAGVFGSAFGLALPGIGSAIGSLIGPLASKIGGLLKQAFGGPSKQELEGRAVGAEFEKQFANTADMINKVGAAYVTSGKSLDDARAAVKRYWDAQKQGADATRSALQEINDLLKRQSEIDDAIHEQGFQSQSEILHQADIANAAYEDMKRRMEESGDFTQTQVDAAYRHYQELMAQLDGAAGQAARDWLKVHQSAEDAAAAGSDASSAAMKAAENSLNDLISQRDQLSKNIAAEAPEPVKGAIQTAEEAQRDSLDAQIKSQAEQYAQLAHDTGQAMAKEITDALERLNIKINIGYNLQGGPSFTPPNGNTGVAGGSNGGAPTSGGPTYEDYVRDYWAPDRDSVLASLPHMAAGGWLRVKQPQAFMIGEAGAEDVAIGGAGRNLARDVASALAPMIGGGSSSGANVVVRVYLDGRDVTRNVVTRVAQGKDGSDVILRRGLGLPV